MNDEGQVLELLMAIQKDIGELKGTMSGFTGSFSKHVEDDKVLASNVKAVELTMARQTGAMRVLTAVGTLVGSVIGASVAHFITKAH
jgi:hypothetical protein